MPAQPDLPLSARDASTGADAETTPSLLAGFGRGVGWTYLSLMLTGGSTFLLAAWSVRRVGTAEYGLYALVMAVSTLLCAFDYALGLAVQRSGARAHAAPDSVAAAGHLDAVHAAHAAYLLLGVAGVAATGLAAAVLVLAGPDRIPYLVPTVALLGVATSVELATAALPAVALAARRFSLRNGAAIAGVVVRIVVALATVDHIGVAGLGLAQLAGMVVERALLLRLLHSRVPWFDPRPFLPDRGALRQVTAYAGPLLLLNVSGQLFAVSDFVAIGVLVGASAVGVYQVATLAPLTGFAVLLLGYNVVFPALAGSDDAAGQETATAFLTGLFSYVGGTGLVLVALLRGDIVRLLLGQRSSTAEGVLLTFCGICLANVILHGLASLLIARGRQGLMARVVAIELPANVVLTVVFVVWVGAVGAAVASLATVVMMDFIVFPVISRGEFTSRALSITWRHGLVPAALGGAVAVVAARLALVADSTTPRLVLGVVAAVVLGAVVGLVLLGPEGRRLVHASLGTNHDAPALSAV